MNAIKSFVTRHQEVTYFVLTFLISWGGIVVVVGPGGFPGTGSQFDALLPFVASAMLAGPAVAGILLTGFVSGTPGLRELLARLLRWRVGARWYVAALLPAPVLAAAVLFACALISPIFTADSKATVLLAGITAGLTTVLEEVGWTGFAVPRLRLRYGAVATGLIVGVVWGAWHLLQGLWIGGTYAGSLPVAVFVAVAFFTLRRGNLPTTCERVSHPEPKDAHFAYPQWQLGCSDTGMRRINEPFVGMRRLGSPLVVQVCLAKWTAAV